jgi:hypothetical protein
MTSSYNFDALTDAFENLPLVRRKWVREHWDEMMFNFACKMYDYVEAAVPEEEEEEDVLAKTTREKNERLNPKGFEVAWCGDCGDYCEILIGTKAVCGNCEESESEAEVCINCKKE